MCTRGTVCRRKTEQTSYLSLAVSLVHSPFSLMLKVLNPKIFNVKSLTLHAFSLFVKFEPSMIPFIFYFKTSCSIQRRHFKKNSTLYTRQVFKRFFLSEIKKFWCKKVSHLKCVSLKTIRLHDIELSPIYSCKIYLVLCQFLFEIETKYFGRFVILNIG